MRLKILTTLFFLINILFANDNPSFEDFEKKQRSSEKDFYIWSYLNQNSLDYQSVIDIFGQSFNVTNDLFFKYAEKIEHDETFAVAQCMQAEAKVLLETNSDCIKAGLSIKKALTLMPLDIDIIISKVEDSYPTFAKELKIINSPIPFTKIISSNKDIIYDIYLNSSDKFRFEKLNYKLPKRTLEKIKDDNKFEEFLNMVITNPKLNFLQSTFFDMDDTTLSSQASFLLALNRVLNKKNDNKLLNYLENAYLKAKNESEKNKILFWKYLISKDESFLKIVLESKTLNIYTLYAQQYYNQTQNIDESFKNPYENILTNCSENRKSIINSIAKEESFFNPLKIDSLNLGLMQMSIKDASTIAFDNNFEFNYNDLLEAKNSINYFSYYLNNLESEFNHPLFIFYAYKDSIENVNSYLNNGLFNLNNEFEPFLSIELYPNVQTRDYGKKALTNYIIYKQILLDDSLKSLVQPLDYLDF